MPSWFAAASSPAAHRAPAGAAAPRDQRASLPRAAVTVTPADAVWWSIPSTSRRARPQCSPRSSVAASSESSATLTWARRDEHVACSTARSSAQRAPASRRPPDPRGGPGSRDAGARPHSSEPGASHGSAGAGTSDPRKPWHGACTLAAASAFDCPGPSEQTVLAGLPRLHLWPRVRAPDPVRVSGVVALAASAASTGVRR